MGSVSPPTDVSSDDDSDQLDACYEPWGSYFECRGCPGCADVRIQALAPLVRPNPPVAEALGPFFSRAVKLSSEDVARGFSKCLCETESCAESTRTIVVSFGEEDIGVDGEPSDPVSWPAVFLIAKRCHRLEVLYIEQSNGPSPSIDAAAAKFLNTPSPFRSLTHFVAIARPRQWSDRLNGNDMITLLQAMPSLKSLSLGGWDDEGETATCCHPRPFELDELILGFVLRLSVFILPWLIRGFRPRHRKLVLDGDSVPPHSPDSLPLMQPGVNPSGWQWVVAPAAPSITSLTVRRAPLWCTQGACGGLGEPSLSWTSVDELRLEEADVVDLTAFDGTPTRLVIQASQYLSFHQTVQILGRRGELPRSFSKLRSVTFGVPIGGDGAVGTLDGYNHVKACVDLELAKKHGQIRVVVTPPEPRPPMPGPGLATPALEDVHSPEELIDFGTRLLLDVLEQALAVGVRVELISFGGARTRIGVEGGKFCFV